MNSVDRDPRVEASLDRSCDVPIPRLSEVEQLAEELSLERLAAERELQALRDAA